MNKFLGTNDAGKKRKIENLLSYKDPTKKVKDFFKIRNGRRHSDANPIGGDIGGYAGVNNQKIENTFLRTFC